MSDTITVVTSCSAAGWVEYGGQFVETFMRHWPSDVALHLVSEDIPADVILAQQWPRPLTAWSLWTASPAAYAFHLRHKTNARAHGRERLEQDKGWTPRKQERGYNFRYDAYRFCKKVFAIASVADSLPGGRLLWVDADVVAFAPVDVEMLRRLLPLDVALSCLDRGQGYHSECGFVGYNLDHPATRPFIKAFAELYASDDVLQIDEWHDSWVFDWLRRKTNIPTFAIPHNSRHHPFVNSELGGCMDHLKGARKEKGRTPAAEVMSSKKRAMPYWMGAAR